MPCSVMQGSSDLLDLPTSWNHNTEVRNSLIYANYVPVSAVRNSLHLSKKIANLLFAVILLVASPETHSKEEEKIQ